MKGRQFICTTLVLALISPIAHADLSEVKQDIKRDSKEAAHKTGEAARGFGHATASAAKAVGHGVAHASREGWDATKHASREGWDATKRTTKRVFHKDGSD
ncbi:hypothetical protein WJ63_00130 [Burkholderia pyrrocinia]|uniref:hypothetical protein n=1 Tax=Burkholderia stagnalis TaxID=1503054 RepID=UPI0007555A84|nr:hypothetical protein [Burkholderia stagnalis]KVN25683.1 hypothetical protein WJ63_00130 [Burkholderia pyrrocinia]